VLLFAVVVGIA